MTATISPNTSTEEPSNDLLDLNNERVDNLAALITVTAEQMDDRNRAEAAIESGSARTGELVRLVFGNDVPSVENYLSSRTLQPEAA